MTAMPPVIAAFGCRVARASAGDRGTANRESGNGRRSIRCRSWCRSGNRRIPDRPTYALVTMAPGMTAIVVVYGPVEECQCSVVVPVETTIEAAVFEVTVCETRVTPVTPDRMNGLPLQFVFVPVKASVNWSSSPG